MMEGSDSQGHDPLVEEIMKVTASKASPPELRSLGENLTPTHAIYESYRKFAEAGRAKEIHSYETWADIFNEWKNHDPSQLADIVLMWAMGVHEAKRLCNKMAAEIVDEVEEALRKRYPSS